MSLVYIWYGLSQLISLSFYYSLQYFYSKEENFFYVITNVEYLIITIVFFAGFVFLIIFHSSRVSLAKELNESEKQNLPEIVLNALKSIKFISNFTLLFLFISPLFNNLLFTLYYKSFRFEFDFILRGQVFAFSTFLIISIPFYFLIQGILGKSIQDIGVFSKQTGFSLRAKVYLQFLSYIFSLFAVIFSIYFYKESFNNLTFDYEIFLYVVFGSLLLISIFSIICFCNGALPKLSNYIKVLDGYMRNDLKKNVSVNSTDELGNIGILINSFTKKLLGVFKDINKIIQNIAEVANQSITYTSNISKNADCYLMFSKEFLESSEVVKNSSDDSSSFINEEQVLIEDTISSFEKLSTQSGETNTLIKETNSSSQELTEVIGVIKNIADQTNLLALNASVEASKAGEQGKGFMVVAVEIKRLAEETIKATKSTSDIISNLQKHFGLVSKSVNKSSTLMKKQIELFSKSKEILIKILEKNKEISRIISGIVEEASEQSSNIKTIEEFSRILSKLFEERLTSQIEELEVLTGWFK